MSALYKKVLFLFILFTVFSFHLKSQTINGPSSINVCETKEYTIIVQNTSGNNIRDLKIKADISELTGFSYVAGTSSIDIAGSTCTAEPTISGTSLVWNINSLCSGGPHVINSGETVVVKFSLVTSCEAASGNLKANISYSSGGNSMTENAVHNIKVNKGFITITKTPSVQSLEVGKEVTWTIKVENTGFGPVHNVVVKDELGAGFELTSSDNGQVQANGQIITWTSNDKPALSSIDPGDSVELTLKAMVKECEGLENKANAKFGCSDTDICYDTAVEGGTASASVERIVKTPLVEYKLKEIQFNYCQEYIKVNLEISNIGDGTAYKVQTLVDLSEFRVELVNNDGVTYYENEKKFKLTNPIEPSKSYTISFKLYYDNWCNKDFPVKPIIWEKLYEDVCGNEFHPPVEMTNILPPKNYPKITVSKSGPAEAEIGSEVRYTISSSYTGATNCGNSGSTGQITVTDTLHEGMIVTNAAEGDWTPGSDGTGGTIVWTYAPGDSFNKTISVKLSDRAHCEKYCNTVFTNNVTAKVEDCCNCTRIASDSFQTAIECQEGIEAHKEVSGTGERCTYLTYTNTYAFSGNSHLTLSSLTFTEKADNAQDYDDSSLLVTLGSTDITNKINVTDTTDGTTGKLKNLKLDFSNAANTDLAEQTLTITYNLKVTENTVDKCSNKSFYSWSTLHIGEDLGSECLKNGKIHEAVEVNVGTPSMKVEIKSLPQTFHKCQEQKIKIELSQTSKFNPKDVKLVLSGLNYSIVNINDVDCASNGVTPTPCTPTINSDGDYEWDFADKFDDIGDKATITLTVQKRCLGEGDLVATAYYDDFCTDDDTANKLCSVIDTQTPTLLLEGDLLIEKNPEVYSASDNSVEWTIYVTNRGAGTAYNVWVEDILGSGLSYFDGQTITVKDETGGDLNHTVSKNKDHENNDIKGCTIKISDPIKAGKRIAIEFKAKVENCENLTNTVNTSWGCGDELCQNKVSDSSIVKIPAPKLINTSSFGSVTSISACMENKGTITLKNAGAVTCYNLEVKETLPQGLTYMSDSSEYRTKKKNGSWTSWTSLSTNPSISGNILTWTKNEITALEKIDKGSSIEIRFDVKAQCNFEAGDVKVETVHENPCGQEYTSTPSIFALTFNEPKILLEKTRADKPIGCSENVTWNIRVTNQSNYAVPVIRLEDILGAAYKYKSSTSANIISGSGSCSNIPKQENNKLYWEIKNLSVGGTVEFDLTATSDSYPCNSDLTNTLNAWWGCGDVDGDASTDPQSEPGACLVSQAITTVREETREPALSYLSVNIFPDSIDACKDNTELTIVIENKGDTDANNIDLEVTLPQGLSYKANSAKVGVGTAPDISTSDNVTPSINGQVLTFGDISDLNNNIANSLEAQNGNDTLVLKFSVKSSCYVTKNLKFKLHYYDCCGGKKYSKNHQYELVSKYPQLSVTKTPESQQVTCGDKATWIIRVTNNGDGLAQVVRVIDTPGQWIKPDVDSSTPGLTDMSGGQWGWEIKKLETGAFEDFKFVGTFNPVANPSDCDLAFRQNNVLVSWACADSIDCDPTTNDYDCADNSSVSAPVATLKMPNLQVSSITPNVTCTSDGVLSGTIRVRVENVGDGYSTGKFIVSVKDNNDNLIGTGSFNGTTISAGSSADINIDTSSWTPTCQAYTLTANVDTKNDICECNESDNTGRQDYTPTIPDIEVSGDTLDIKCVKNGVFKIFGKITISNTGCGNPLNSNIPVQFTLYPQSDCSGTPIETWTQTLTGVNIKPGVTHKFTITSKEITGNYYELSQDCNTSVKIEADYDHSICEKDGDNNTRCVNLSSDCIDVDAKSITATISCNNDNLTGEIKLVVANAGGKPIKDDFYIKVEDGQGWQINKSFSDLGGSLPINANSEQELTINWNRDFSVLPRICSYNLSAKVDSDGELCQVDISNDAAKFTYTNTLPNLKIESIDTNIVCQSDGTYSGIKVTVSNDGCADVSGAVLRLSSNCGFTFTDKTIDLKKGDSEDFIFNFENDYTACNCTFTAKIDPDDEICEITGDDNSVSSNSLTLNISDLSINASNLRVECISAGEVSVDGTVDIYNSGCVTSQGTIPLFFTMYSETGCKGEIIKQWSETFTGNISPNGSKQFIITPKPLSIDFCKSSTDHYNSILIELDKNKTICDWDRNNNRFCADDISSNVVELSLDSLEAKVSVNSDSSIKSEITMKISNIGGNDIPDDFLISIDDVQGWTIQKKFSELGGVLPFSKGDTQTLKIDWDRDFKSNPPICDFNITASLDINSDLCQCTKDNDTLIINYNAKLIDLSGEFTGITCADDGKVNIDIKLNNHACADSGSFSVTLKDNKGHEETIVIDNIGAFSSRAITFKDWISNEDTIFTLIIDGNNTLYELDESNNSIVYEFKNKFPDLSIENINKECLDDEISFNVYVANKGENPAITTLKVYDNENNLVYTENLSLQGYEKKNIVVKLNGLFGKELNYRFVLDEENNVCEKSQDNNAKSIIVFCEKIYKGKPVLTANFLCPESRSQGGLFTFTFVINNSGDLAAQNIKAKCLLPKGFSYVPNSSMLESKVISDPVIGEYLIWNIGEIEKGSSQKLTFSAVPAIDVDPARYCVEGYIEGISKADTNILSSERAKCCTVVLGKQDMDCCLNIEQDFLGSRKFTDSPKAFIQPYFNTKMSMQAIYAILNLWDKNIPLYDSYSYLIRNKLRRYAKSTAEEFYFKSRMGVDFKKSLFKLSYAGSYPNMDKRGNSWIKSGDDNKMTLTQISFELLAINKLKENEDRKDYKEKYEKLFKYRLDFIKNNIDNLKHSWSLNQKDNSCSPTKKELTLKDKAILYYSLTEIGESADMVKKIKDDLIALNNKNIDKDNLEAELYLMLSLKKQGDSSLLNDKVNSLYKIFKDDSIDFELKHYALFMSVLKDYKEDIYKEIKNKLFKEFYVNDLGILASLQEDFSYNLTLEDSACILMALNNKAKDQERTATILYRMFDEAGLFLKKRNMAQANPFYGLLKNNSRDDNFIKPIISFIKSDNNSVPVFIDKVKLYSNLIDREYIIPFETKDYCDILSESYEEKSSEMSYLSFALEFLGDILSKDSNHIYQEESFTLIRKGEKYLETILHSKAGYCDNGVNVFPLPKVALKGNKNSLRDYISFNSKEVYNTETFADKLLAERLYLKRGKGKMKDKLLGVNRKKIELISHFQTNNSIPKAFYVFKDYQGQLSFKSSKERASAIVIAKLIEAYEWDKEQKEFLKEQFKKSSLKDLDRKDLIFLAYAPKYKKYFKDIIKDKFQNSKGDWLKETAYRLSLSILGKKIKDDKINNWNDSMQFPLNNQIQIDSEGQIFRYKPINLVLYLLSTMDNKDNSFYFSRVLDVFTYLLENEWILEDNNGELIFPSSNYVLIRSGKKRSIEPGDIVDFRVRVDNNCNNAFANPMILNKLFLKGLYGKGLIYLGGEEKDNLKYLGNFTWAYDSPLMHGDKLIYNYRVKIPINQSLNSFSSEIVAASSKDYDEFISSNHDCQDRAVNKGLKIVNFKNIPALVFNDRNLNGIKEKGEEGISGLRFKDSFGNVYHSSAGGRFEISCGEEFRAIQLDISSLKGHYQFKELPTKYVNRNNQGLISFPLIKCEDVNGFVYKDSDGNQKYDEGEEKVSNVYLKAVEKETVSDEKGNFIFKNIPVNWKDDIVINPKQIFRSDLGDNIRVHINK